MKDKCKTVPGQQDKTTTQVIGVIVLWLPSVGLFGVYASVHGVRYGHWRLRPFMLVSGQDFFFDLVLFFI